MVKVPYLGLKLAQSRLSAVVSEAHVPRRGASCSKSTHIHAAWLAESLFTGGTGDSFRGRPFSNILCKFWSCNLELPIVLVQLMYVRAHPSESDLEQP